MQLFISHKLPENLELPLHYHHILQSVLYHNLREEYGYSDFLHQSGYTAQERQFRMFVFSLLKGKYEITQKQISFRNQVSFEVRSADVRMLRILKDNLEQKGITYLKQHYDDLQLRLEDKVITQNRVRIRMLSPLSVYSTDAETGKTYFYQPGDAEFSDQVNANFHRKYKAYTGIEPKTDICIISCSVKPRDKYVTSYKGFYVSGWFGEYELYGEAKYLDFLYQVGLGSRNAQGFGMFEVVEEHTFMRNTEN